MAEADFPSRKAEIEILAHESSLPLALKEPGFRDPMFRATQTARFRILALSLAHISNVLHHLSPNLFMVDPYIINCSLQTKYFDIFLVHANNPWQWRSFRVKRRRFRAVVFIIYLSRIMSSRNGGGKKSRISQICWC